MTLKNNKWDIRFLQMASMVGNWSKDDTVKVGAVIVDEDNRVLSIGFNGLPKGVSDAVEIYDGDTRVVIHAEENAILFTQRQLNNCTIYINPLPTCSLCAAKIIQVGIKRVVTMAQKENSKWEESFEVAKGMYVQAMVAVDVYDIGEVNDFK